MAKIGIQINSGTLEKKEFIVGIDLGTTNSLIAITDENGETYALKGTGGHTLVPSIIHFGDHILVGQEAKPYLESDPKNTIYSIKRLLGKSYKDLQEEKDNLGYRIMETDEDALVRILIKNKFYTPIELSAYILKELKIQAEKQLDTELNKCVITVPAYFNDTQRQATRDAGKLAGWEVLRIINEPTAASLAYGLGLNPEDEKKIVVYDLGGGTFDVSVLHIHNGIFEVLSTQGDTYLGGDDFDQKLVQMILNKLGRNIQEMEEIPRQQIRLLAENCKKELSLSDMCEVSFENISVRITKEEFEKNTQSLIDRTLECCQKAMQDSGIPVDEIDEIILVGGSTRIPAIKDQVSTFFKKPVNDTLNPDEVVALGASIQAGILAGNNKDILLLDVTPLSLGIETMGGLMDVLIPRNSKIPIKAERQYTTQKDGQNGMEISVYQGERDLVQYNRKLASFSLKNIPAMPAGLPKVNIQFVLDADGILQVRAKELRSGTMQSITVTPQYGLTDQEVEKMLRDSLDNAQEDMKTRSLEEAKTEAVQMIYQTEQFIKKNEAYLSDMEIQETSRAIRELQQSLTDTDHQKILTKTDQLNNISKAYAQRVMDMAIAKALKGNKI